MGKFFKQSELSYDTKAKIFLGGLGALAVGGTVGAYYLGKSEGKVKNPDKTRKAVQFGFYPNVSNLAGPQGSIAYTAGYMRGRKLRKTAQERKYWKEENKDFRRGYERARFEIEMGARAAPGTPLPPKESMKDIMTKYHGTKKTAGIPKGYKAEAETAFGDIVVTHKDHPKKKFVWRHETNEIEPAEKGEL